MRGQYDIFTGVDLALSSSIGADYTVITTIGIDKDKNRRIFDIRRFKGRSMSDQLREIQDVYYNLRPQKIFVEDNQFQRVFKDELVRHTDMPVEGFTTTARNKNSLEKGIPSLQILFENGKFIIPRKTERDRRITDVLINELQCFTYVNGKLAGLGSHDDCLRKGAMVQTIDGLVPIEKIKVGDLVLTHKGRYMPVTNTIKKPYKGKCYKITPFGSASIEITKEHPILTTRKRQSRVHRGGPPSSFFDAEWLSPDKIEKGKQRFMFPVNKTVKGKLRLDLGEFCTGSVMEGRQILSEGGKLFYNNYRDNAIDQIVKVDKGFCKFMGIYLSEGSARETGFNIGLSSDETDIADEIESYLKSIGLKPRRYIRNKSLTIDVGNKVWGAYLMRMGKQPERKLPRDFMFIEPRLQKVIVEYWMKGDGWESKNSMIGATTSIELANQMYIFLLRNGIVSNIRKRTTHRYGVPTLDQWWVDVGMDHWRRASNKSSNKKSTLFGDYRISAIREYEVFDIDEDVYNIEVQKDESYVVNHTIVHNCVMSLWIANEAASSSTFSFSF